MNPTTMETLIPSVSTDNISRGVEEVNNFTQRLTSSTGIGRGWDWSNCPEDVLMIIFSKLDVKSLLNCMDVNKWWRDIFEYIAQHNGLWDDVAQEGMWSRGVTFRRKSTPTASWRELFFNSRLWRHVTSAHLELNYVDAVEDIRYLHVYKDVLIVVYGENLLMKFYEIGISKSVRDTDSVASQSWTEGNETQHDEETNHLTKASVQVDKTKRMMKKLSQVDSMKRLIVLGDNCYYTLDRKNILRCFKYDESTNSWTEHALARYYGCNKSISDIHIYNDDVYLLLKSGNVMRLDRQGRNFEAALRTDLHWYRVMQYAILVENDKMKTYIDKVFKVDVPDYSTECLVLFHKCSAVISVPSDRPFRVSYDKETNNMVLEYPGLSCATQHGDVLFLGFESGKIEIVLPNNIITNGGIAEVSINIQDFPDYVDSEPTIVALDVYEANQSHYLFVALRSDIYKLVISYPSSVKRFLGL